MLASCTSVTKSSEPRVELRDAVKNVAEADRVSFEFGLDATPEALKGLAATDPTDEPITDEEVQQVLGSSLKLTLDEGEDDKVTTDNALALLLRVDNTELLELRVVDELLYLRADAQKARTLAEVSDEEFAQVQELAAAPGFEFLGPALRGEWLKVDPKPLKDFAEGLSSGGAVASPAPSLDPEKARQDVEAFVDAVFSQDAKVTSRTEAGDGERLEVEVPTRAVYTRFVAALPALTQNQLPEEAFADLPPAAEVPDKVLKFSAFIEDEKLTRVDFDITQLSEEPVTTGAVNLRVDVTEPKDPVKAPEGSVEVNLLRLLGQFAGGFGAGGDPLAEDSEGALSEEPISEDGLVEAPTG